jgi:hypothetical protein
MGAGFVWLGMGSCSELALNLRVLCFVSLATLSFSRITAGNRRKVFPSLWALGEGVLCAAAWGQGHVNQVVPMEGWGRTARHVERVLVPSTSTSLIQHRDGRVSPSGHALLTSCQL